MTAINKANRTYSENYSISLEKRDLTTSNQFHTHTCIHMEKLHRIGEALLLPARLSLQALAHTIEPLPGKDKDHPIKGVAIRVAALVFLLLNIPFAAISILVGFPLRFIDHSFRPAICYIDASADKPPKKLQLTQDQPLHVRTHNLGFVTTSMSTLGDLRSPKKRAKELVESINKDPFQPDLIFFQEAFHEDATKILCNGIKTSYPYIIHSIAPHISGFNSGALIASKYPIEKVDFHTLPGMLGPERLSPRGITHISIASEQGRLDLYGVHTQALIGEARANARFNQINELNDHIKKNENDKKIIVGDFNTSRVTAWGEDNANQSENKVMERMNEHFNDVYLNDHDAITGKRTKDKPHFLTHDNERIKEELEEPRGSWYHGPFANPGVILSKKMRKDRKKHGYPEPQKAQGVIVKPATWGTPKWRSEQTANTARFDYILTPKESPFTAKAEIRRSIPAQHAQSAPTDHLPVDGLFWIANETT